MANFDFSFDFFAEEVVGIPGFFAVAGAAGDEGYGAAGRGHAELCITKGRLAKTH